MRDDLSDLADRRGDGGELDPELVNRLFRSAHSLKGLSGMFGLDGVSELYSTAGEVDLIAIVRVREFEQIAEVVAGRINKVAGVLETETHIAFRAYSRHDLESAFSIGFESAD